MPDLPWLNWGHSHLAHTGMGHRQEAATWTFHFGEGCGGFSDLCLPEPTTFASSPSILLERAALQVFPE